jgi:uncharacterized protein YjbI with pentapeptide repeats
MLEIQTRALHGVKEVELMLAKIGITIACLASLVMVAPVWAETSQSVQRLVETGECSECDLRGANLQDTHLIGADLRNAQLQGANLSGANLEGADLTGANLENVNLSYQIKLDLLQIMH